MRFWYQGLIPQTPESLGYYSSMRGHGSKIAADVTLDLHALPGSFYPLGLGPAEFTRHVAGELVEVAAMAASLVEGAQTDFDAVIIGTLQEPGLQVARTLTDKPVVGYGQAAALVGRCLGRRLGILAFNPALIPLFRERLEAHVPGSVGPVHELRISYAELLNGFLEEGDIRERVVAGCRALIGAGADVIVPGQMLLAELTWHLGIHRVDDVPLLDALGALILLAQALVTLNSVSQVGVTRSGFEWSRPPRGILSSVRDLGPGIRVTGSRGQ